MKVELLEVFGDDEMISNIARVSYQKQSSNYTKEQNYKLLKYLWNHKHVSPFKHPVIQFRVKCPIYVERQLFKHQIGAPVNSISGRYVDFSDTYTEIKEWRKQSKDSKQGSEGLVEDQDTCKDIEKNVISFSKAAYKALIEEGVSKEQARTILPLSLNTEFIATYSLLAFIHMCNLRLKKDAQQETREVVVEMYKQLIELPNFGVTMGLVDKNWIKD